MNSDKWYPEADVNLFDPRKTEFVWNEDQTMFQAIRLAWWDDASYIAYQSGCDEHDEEYEAELDVALISAQTKPGAEDEARRKYEEDRLNDPDFIPF